LVPDLATSVFVPGAMISIAPGSPSATCTPRGAGKPLIWSTRYMPTSTQILSDPAGRVTHRIISRWIVTEQRANVTRQRSSGYASCSMIPTRYSRR